MVGAAQRPDGRARSHVGDRACARRIEADRRDRRESAEHLGSRGAVGHGPYPGRGPWSTIPGILEIRRRTASASLNGIPAVTALERLRGIGTMPERLRSSNATRPIWDSGCCLKTYTQDVSAATPEMIQKAVDSTVPRVLPMFWGFRVMVGLGFLMLLLFALTTWATLKGDCMHRRWLLKWAMWMLPAPWIAAELGWFVAEYGRQPWTIYGVLPTHLSVSALGVQSLYGSLAGFVGFYTLLLVVEVYLMVVRAPGGWQPWDRSLRPGGRPWPGRARLKQQRTEKSHAGLPNPEDPVVAAGGCAAGGFRHHGWSRHGRGHLAAFRGQDRRRAARGHQHRGAPLGWQSGLVHHRRWRHLCRVAPGVRHGIQRFLLGHAGGVVGAVLPPCGLRLPQQDPGPAWRRTWDWGLFIGGFVPR